MSKPTVFISYSHKDEEWKKRLLPHLKALELADLVTVWDDRKIDAGDSWYPEIKQAMEAANVAVCLVSADFLASNFCIKEEVPFLLKKREEQGMLFIPILTRPCLWKAIRWLAAIQMLPRDDQSLSVEFKENYDTIFQQVAEMVYEYKPPAPKALPEAELEVTVTEKSPPAKTFRGAYPGPVRGGKPQPVLPKISLEKLPLTGAELFGRNKELERLDQAWESAQTHVFCFVAWGGVGKSTLVNKWLEYLQDDNYRGAKRVFAWSFYSQGTGEKVTSADLFIKEALGWFDDPQPEQGSPWDKGKRLAELVRREKTLLILDGLEPLQSYSDFEKGKIKDPALAVLVTELAKNNPGLCVITTREAVPELDRYPHTTQTIPLDQISDEAGRALLRVRGIRGTDAELEAITRAFGNHALAINLLAEYLHLFPGHPRQKALDIPDLDVPVEKGKHPRRVMEAFVKHFGNGAELELLCILGLFDRPAEQAAIDAVLQGDPIPGLTEHLKNLSEKQWAELLERLRNTKLIARKSAHRPGTLDCHPLREHFGEKLRGIAQSAWRIAHERRYEYYKNLPKK